MFDISSLIQKAIRRGDMEFACYAAHEMMWKYRPYLWTRLLITSAEDCYDLVTGRVLYLKKKDLECKDVLETRYLSEAVTLLVRTRKNRDADFFACNLLYSKERKDFPLGTSQLVTRHGHDLKEMTILLKKAILECDEENIGYIANEIRCWYRKLFWVVARDVAKTLGSDVIAREVVALQEVDLAQNPKSSSCIFITKAIVVFIRMIRYRTDNIFFSPDMRTVEDVMKYSEPRQLPNYTYDCHTHIGKMRGMTGDDFIISEQASLNPHVRGEYDDCDWVNSRKWRTEGRGHDFNTPKLPKKMLEDANNGIFPSTLFDL
jgi:hypothetical protein